MSKIAINEFEFLLESPIKIARAGDEDLVFRVIVKAPTARNRAHLIRLKQGFLKAAVEASKNSAVSGAKEEAKDGASDEISAEAIMALLYISDIDLPKLEDEFRALLLSGGLSVVEGVPTNAHMVDQISHNDFEKMMGQYFVNFIVSSSMKL